MWGQVRKLKDNYEICRHCGFLLQGEPIPESSQHLFGATHFSQKIGLYSLRTDRTIKYICPNCEGEVE